MSAGVGSLSRPRPADRRTQTAGTLKLQAVVLVVFALFFELPALSFELPATR
jgi:hypothetical protein